MSFKISHVNCRSLLAHFNDFRHEYANKGFNLIAITESWLNRDIDNNLLEIENYELVRNDRRDLRGGGIAAYIGKGLSFEIILMENYEFLESLWLKIKVSGEECLLGIIYRKPNTNIQNFFEIFEETLINMYSHFESITCIGDFNIDVSRFNDRQVSQLITICETFNLRQIITEPTRITNNSSSIIDLIFTNHCNILDIGVINSTFSDHFGVFCEFQSSITEEQPLLFSFRALKDINLQEFQRDLEAISFQTIYVYESIEDQINFLNTNLINLFNKHAPIKNKKIHKRKYAPWMTDNVKFLQKLRDKALKDFKSSKLPEKWDYYKQLRNYTTTAIRAEKKAFYNNKLKNCTYRDKWKELNKIFPKKQKRVPDSLIKPNDFNKYFIDCTKNVFNSVNSYNTCNFYLNNAPNRENRFAFQTVDLNEITKILLCIKSQAFGVDQLNITLIQLCCPFIIPYILHIINQCIIKNYFPVCWKKAFVLPLPKVQNPTDFSHFRSISVLPTMSKILERILNSQMRAFLEFNKILPPKQSGFRGGYSCASAMADVVDEVIRARDSDRITALVLLDYTKAFDFVNHKILLAVLHFIGFTGSAIALISSFLTERVQQVKIENIVSDPLDVKNGVPQGSILGPLLFTIYTLRFYLVLKNCLYHLYADDTQLYFSFIASEYKIAEKKINEDLERILEISTNHCLKLNASKSSIMLIGNRNLTSNLSNDFNIKIAGEKIPTVQKCKSLGIIIDTELRFKDHVSSILKKAYLALKLIYIHRQYLGQDVKKLLCDSLVLSQCNYCDVVYGWCLDYSDRARLQKLQNSCIRLIFGIRRGNRVSYKLRELAWLNMTNRRILHSRMFFYKILKYRSPPYLYQKITFRTDVHHLNLRRRNICIPRHNKELFKRSFSYNVAHQMNSLNLDFDRLQFSVVAFRESMVRVLMDQQCECIIK